MFYDERYNVYTYLLSVTYLNKQWSTKLNICRREIVDVDVDVDGEEEVVVMEVGRMEKDRQHTA